jgi:hypothetical protein
MWSNAVMAKTLACGVLCCEFAPRTELVAETGLQKEREKTLLCCVTEN